MTRHKAKKIDRRVAAAMYMGIGLAAAFMFFEIGFFASLWIGIWLPPMDWHGVVVLVSRGFIVCVIFALMLILAAGLIHKMAEPWMER